ncbi:MAG: ATP/GTP-binding protein [Acidiferrobacteraceae bacterium]
MDYLTRSPDQVSPDIEEAFFSSLKLRNGTFKTTFPGRFFDINKQIIDLLKAGDIRVDNLLDIGISSGVSTLELYDELTSAGYRTRITGTDLMVDARIVSVFPRCFALMDSTGYPLRFDFFKWGLAPWIVVDDYRSTGFFVLRKLLNVIFHYRLKAICKSPHHAFRDVKLITPRLGDNTNISVRQDDITKLNESFCDKFNFIRAANILNRGYFSEKELAAILSNVKRYLTKPRGHLLIMRTLEDENDRHIWNNHGTLFSVDNHEKCEIVRRFGLGSEVDDIVLGKAARTTAVLRK